MKTIKGWNTLFKDMRERITKEKEIKATGGNKYLQLEARLGHDKTGSINGDISVYAIQTIKNKAEAKDFYKGFVEDVKQHSDKYPATIMDAEDYVKSDIYMALNLNFAEDKTHKLWYKVLGLKK